MKTILLVLISDEYNTRALVSKKNNTRALIVKIELSSSTHELINCQIELRHILLV